MSNDAKMLVARHAVTLVESGMVVGLGSGSTATLFIKALGAALREGNLARIVGIPTSRESEQLASAEGIPLTDFATHERCDLTIDGADEIDPELELIKGLGGALLREKLVAQNSARLVIIADDTKAVSRLGTKGPLPVEVTPFGLPAHERFLRSLGAEPVLRRTGASIYTTDNGNHILDCRFPQGIADVRELAGAIASRAGIVEHGLFIGMASTAVLATKDGRVETRHRR